MAAVGHMRWPVPAASRTVLFLYQALTALNHFSTIGLPSYHNVQNHGYHFRSGYPRSTQKAECRRCRLLGIYAPAQPQLFSILQRRCRPISPRMVREASRLRLKFEGAKNKGYWEEARGSRKFPPSQPFDHPCSDKTLQNKDVVIFWGSQSGTAEGFANRLVRDFRSRFGIDALAADLADYDPESIANIPEAKLALFIVSTYGEGDPSDNSTQFLSWLRSNKTAQFPSLRYAAFGLGNSKYKFYNKVIDVVTESLDNCQAKPLLPVGRADDANGTTEEDFAEWKQLLFSLFRDQLGFEERPQQYESTLRVVEDPSLDSIDLHVGEPVGPKASGKAAAMVTSPIHPLTVKVAKKLMSSTDRNCLYIELDTSEFSELKYKTGDHLAIWPSNPMTEVSRLLDVLELQERKSMPLLITSLDPSVQTKVPSPTTIKSLFRSYLEICAPIPRETALSIAQFSPSPSSKAALTRLADDRDTYRKHCETNHVTLSRLLESVLTPGGSWSCLPLEFILEILPTLTPRYYSISSSSVVSPKTIALTVATSTLNSNNLPIPGLATDYLVGVERNHNGAMTAPPSNALDTNSNVPGNGKVFAHVRKSKFKLPALAKNPIIMIASGSGIAPFRGFLYERSRVASLGREVGPSMLFFGCRNASEDHLYADELQSLEVCQQNKVSVITAFSRTETNKAGGKMYVQDRVEERDEEVIKLLTEENAYLYICGSAGMARDVAERLGQCIRRRLGWNEGELREWSEQMRKTQRWREDVWG